MKLKNVSIQPVERKAFSLLEMLTAMVIVAGIMLVVVRAMGRVQDVWVRTNSRVKEAQDGRAAVDTLTLRLSRAVLNPRWTEVTDGENPALLVDSDLHFVCGPVSQLRVSPTAVGHAVFFQAPLGYHVTPTGTSTNTSSTSTDEFPHLIQALNAWGYFVEFGPDPVRAPSFLGPAQAPSSQRNRFRLMEFRQPTLELNLFQMDTSIPPVLRLSTATSPNLLYQWFTTPLSQTQDFTRRRCTVVAENVLALIMSPREGEVDQGGGPGATGPTRIAPDYLFDSRRHQWEKGSVLAESNRHRLPPLIRVAVIVLEESDWSKLDDGRASGLGQELTGVINGSFSSASSFEQDVDRLTGDLNRRKLRFKILPFDIAYPAGRPAS